VDIDVRAPADAGDEAGKDAETADDDANDSGELGAVVACR
jgi:hypothetical protein